MDSGGRSAVPTAGDRFASTRTDGPDDHRYEIRLGDYVLDEANDCLLATRMNGQRLPRDHGFPARVLLPGVVGARNVKWVERIVLRNDEGLGPWNNHCE